MTAGTDSPFNDLTPAEGPFAAAFIARNGLMDEYVEQLRDAETKRREAVARMLREERATEGSD